MTDWNRISEFYKLISQRDVNGSAQFGERMLALILQLRDSPDLSHIEADTAMYNLMIWIEGISNQCLYISWQDGRFQLSLDAFEDIECEASQQEILPIILRYVKQMNDTSDGTR